MKGERSFLLCNVHMVFQGNLGTILKSTLREMKKKTPRILLLGRLITLIPS